MTHSELAVLADATAVALLRTRHFGRIAFAHAGWPVILPVNFAFDDPTVIIRTDHGAKLVDSPLSAVAFEVDDTDPNGLWGWSVLIQGPAFDITEAEDERSKRLRTIEIAAWAPGEKDHWLTVTAVNLTARSYGDVPALRDRAAPRQHPPCGVPSGSAAFVSPTRVEGLDGVVLSDRAKESESDVLLTMADAND